MNREWLIAGIVALLFHGLLLFGFHLESAAVPLPVSDSAVDVNLVAAAPSSEPPAEPPPSEPVPPPSSVEPPPQPVPEPSPEVPPAPAPPEPEVRHEAVKPAHPNTTASKVARPAPAARNPGAASTVPNSGGPGNSGVRARSNPKPPYPAEARRLHQEGRVLLEVQVGSDGRATSVSVKRSSGSAILDNAAVEGVQRWTFEPARAGGLAVPGRADVPVVFSLSQ